MPTDPTRVKEIFLQATEFRDAALRITFLDSACSGDSDLRERVEALLRSHDTAGSFLGKPAVALPDAGFAQAMTVSASQLSAGTLGAHPDEQSARLSYLAASSKPNSLGRLGHYEVLEVLGQGGFGIVFRAFDETLQRIVAIKVLAPALAATSPARKRFLREAQSSAKIRHENVVHIYAVEEQPLPYLVMEFVPGETLQQRLDRTGPLDVAEVIQIGRQIAEGLAAAHATGLIHRDIKPANILIESGPGGRVKITDFGLARAADDASLTHSGAVAGTPTFMAPEQARGETLDHRADLFSLGSVLYTICSGRPPFRASNSLAVLKRVAEDTPRPIPEIIPEVPHWVCEIITRLHAKQPDNRIASAREVADLLSRGADAMQGQSKVSAPPEAPLAGEHIWRSDEASAHPIRIPSQLPPHGKSSFRTHLRTIAIVAMLLFAGLGLTEANGVTDFRGTVIRLLSSDGTLAIEIDDPDISLQIDESDIVIRGAGAKEIRLKPGQYKVRASKDGKVVQQELVTVTRNDRQVVRITREGSPATPGSPDRRAAEYAMSIGGTTMIIEQGKERQLFPGNAVPPGVFDLTVVSLINNQLANDAGMDHFIGCKHLLKLDLENTNISPAKIWELKNALPSCTVIWDGDIKLLPGSPDRRAAEFVLSAGGNISIKGGGIFRAVFSRSQLPRGAFFLRLVDLRNNKKVTDADLVLFKECDRNQSLILGGTEITDVGLAHIRDCKQLAALDLSGTKVTDEGLAHLNDHLSLTGLALNATRITDGGLINFKYCRNLAHLDLGETEVTDVGLAHFQNCKTFETIWLPRTQVSDEGLGFFKDCKSLAHLNVAQTALGDAGLAHFQDCKNFVSILLSGTKVTDVGLANFKDCTKLAFLELSHTQIGDAGLAQFKDCKHLVHLDLADSQVSDKGLLQLVGYPKLYTLNVKQTRVTEAGVKQLAANLPSCKITWNDGVIKPTVNHDPDRRVVEWLQAPREGSMAAHVFFDNKELMFPYSTSLSETPFELRRLSVRHHPRVSDETADLFRGLRHLTHLNIYECEITDETLTAFEGCTELQELQLRGTRVTDAGVAKLAKFSKLTYLNLANTAVTEETLNRLGAALPKCQIDWNGGTINAPSHGKRP